MCKMCSAKLIFSFCDPFNTLDTEQCCNMVWTDLFWLQFRKNIGETDFRFFLKHINAIEQASTDGEVINDFDERKQRSTNEKTSWAANRDCWQLGC